MGKNLSTNKKNKLKFAPQKLFTEETVDFMTLELQIKFQVLSYRLSI
jgi:hypothetical protein